MGKTSIQAKGIGGGAAAGARLLAGVVAAGLALAVVAGPRPATAEEVPAPRTGVVYIRYGHPGAVRIRQRVTSTDTTRQAAPALSSERITELVREEMARYLRRGLAAARAGHVAPASGTSSLRPVTPVPASQPSTVIVQPAPAAPAVRAPNPPPAPGGGPPAAPSAAPAARTAHAPEPPSAPPEGREELEGRSSQGEEGQAGQREGGGPGEVGEVRQSLLVSGLLRSNDVIFRSGSSELLPYSYETLDAVGRVLRQFPAMRIRVEGYTDDVGGRSMNLALSERRAESVRQYLVDNLGIRGTRIEVRGYGEAYPVASGHDPTSRALNRRVEFRVLNPEKADDIQG